MPKRRSERNTASEQRSVAPHVRDRQRRVAEREASRLARPDARPTKVLGHADRKKSAVSSTPSGYVTASVTAPKEWCGPFSVARRMIAEREEAKRQRELELEEATTTQHPLDGAMKELDAANKRKAHPSMTWKSSIQNQENHQQMSSSSLYAKRERRAKVGQKIPSLFELCLQFVAVHFDHVESLGPAVDADVRKAVANQLIASDKLCDTNFPALAEPGIERLEVVDCSSISAQALADQLSILLKTGLCYLALDQAGRCFGSKAAAVVANETNSDMLALSIGGAYLLKDADANNLVSKTCPLSLEFKACPLVGSLLCDAIATAYGTTGKQLLELAFEDLPSVTAESFMALARQKDVFCSLKTLSLRSMDSLTDDVVDQFLASTAATLEGLDLSHNYNLTDAILSSLRSREIPHLESLVLTGLKNLTATGLEALFTPVDGASPPPSLTTLILNNCDHEAVSNHVVKLMSDGGRLVHLDIQGSTVVTDVGMEHLAKSSAQSLQELHVSYCPEITDQGLGYLVDTCGDQLVKIAVWGNAQISDMFLDGNKRVNDPSLEIVGAWMKKTTGTT